MSFELNIVATFVCLEIWQAALNEFYCCVLLIFP